MLTSYSDRDTQIVNNGMYNDLGQKWYLAEDDPVALLRAEARLRSPWICAEILRHMEQPAADLRVLDVGCGAGFLSNYLASAKMQVTGVDLSESSLDVARQMDLTRSATYLVADAYKLPFADASFDVITSTDFLEHVSEPQIVLSEISRCLKPGGLFFFHTFNKNRLAQLVVIKALEWFVKNTPSHLHVLELFIKPQTLTKWLSELKMQVIEIRGIRPVVLQWPMLKLIFRGIVAHQFRFTWTRSLMISYTGFARRS